MYITNPNAIAFSKVYKCGKAKGEYLINNYNVPLLTIDNDGKYVFSHTDSLEQALNSLSFIAKMFLK